MNPTTVIPTDLVTPLGAYLRLREQGRAAFLLESVEHGRLGRHSFVGLRHGARVVRRGRGARRSRSSATSPTTMRRRSSRPCRCPQPARARPRAGSSSPTRSSASTTRTASPRCSGATPTSTTALLEGPRPELPSPNGDGRATRAASRPASTTSGACAARSSTSAPETRSRSSSPSAPSGRPLPERSPIYRTLRRINPSPYNFLLDLGDISLVGSSPETLVKLDGRRASVNPIAGHRPPRARTTSSGCSRPRRTAPST